MTSLAPPTIVDVGARFGLHPSLRAFDTFGSFHLFEPDPAEAERLSQRYRQQAQDYSVYPLALSDKPGELTLKLRKHRALSSFYDFDARFFADISYKDDEIREEDEVKVPVSTVDELFASKAIDILKTDTEGADYDVLQGARSQLSEHVLVVRSEVTFCEIIPGRPLFGDVNRMLSEAGFHLLNIDYAGQGVARTPYTRLDRFGQLLSSDATWIKKDEAIYDSSGRDPGRDALILARFLFHNHATDVAVWHLLKCLEKNAEALTPHLDEPLCLAVRADVAKLIKDLSYVPGGRHQDLMACYQRLFQHAFPPIHEYYIHFEG